MDVSTGTKKNVILFFKMEIVKAIKGCYNLELLDPSPTILRATDFKPERTSQIRLFFRCAKLRNVSVNLKNITDKMLVTGVGDRMIKCQHQVTNIKMLLLYQTQADLERNKFKKLDSFKKLQQNVVWC